MPIYTRYGDFGETRLFSGKRVIKSTNIVKALGSLDCLNSIVGLTISQIEGLRNRKENKKIKQLLTQIQRTLFYIGTGLANSSFKKSLVKNNFLSRQVNDLEKEIDKKESILPQLKKFILPQGTLSASYLHLCRSTCRRTEVEVIMAIGTKKDYYKEVIAYLNRLSDLFFILARWVNFLAKRKEIIWQQNEDLEKI